MREQRIGPQAAPDWARLIAEVVQTGLTHAAIGQRMGAMLTTRMLRAYGDGAQPVHFRGEALISLWCDRLKRDRTALPMIEVVRGHRAVRPKSVDLSPKMLNVQALMEAVRPPVQQVERQGVKRKAKAEA